jgi:hypothetical protein
VKSKHSRWWPAIGSQTIPSTRQRSQTMKTGRCWSPSFMVRTERANPTSTEFKLQYVDGKNVYAFGCRVSDKLVDAEWLSLLREGKEISVYERACQRSIQTDPPAVESN